MDRLYSLPPTVPLLWSFAARLCDNELSVGRSIRSIGMATEPLFFPADGNGIALLLLLLFFFSGDGRMGWRLLPSRDD